MESKKKKGGGGDLRKRQRGGGGESVVAPNFVYTVNIPLLYMLNVTL